MSSSNTANTHQPSNNCANSDVLFDDSDDGFDGNNNDAHAVVRIAHLQVAALRKRAAELKAGMDIFGIPQPPYKVRGSPTVSTHLRIQSMALLLQVVCDGVRYAWGGSCHVWAVFARCNYDASAVCCRVICTGHLLRQLITLSIGPCAVLPVGMDREACSLLFSRPGLHVCPLSSCRMQELVGMERELDLLERIWGHVREWQTAYGTWKDGSFIDIKVGRSLCSATWLGNGLLTHEQRCQDWCNLSFLISLAHRTHA